MILVLASFLMIIDHMIVDLPEPLDYRLFIAGILATCHLTIELVHNLITITEIVLNSSSTRLVVKHVEHLAKIHWCSIWSAVSDQPEHDTIRVVLQLDVLVHPYLT
ncbi:AC5 [Sida angular mosaic virus]|uniref:AC5 n=1 Tax=Sida angular mosaic virus TaxID=1904882 RepID=A0A1D8GVB0_9GEMI|nr:AC5 [Sida angular mosaic virus]AOT83436.1 AC5 [Sida angular mosaic virus]